jgi:hypothetical protein
MYACLVNKLKRPEKRGKFDRVACIHSIASSRVVCILSLHLHLPYSLLMRTESRSKGSGSTKSKGGANKLAHKSLQSDGRSKAQKKADTKYYEACVFNHAILCSILI